MYTAGEVVNGVVDGIAGYGAFINLPDGRTGLVHVSKIADEYVKRVGDWVGEGDEVEVRVLSDQGEKINLALENAPNSRRRNFENQLEKYLKEAERSRKDLYHQQSQRLE